MKKLTLFAVAAIAGVLLFAGISRKAESPYGFTSGTPQIKSITALTFGPTGVLFIGDSQSATVFAVDTKDTKKASAKAYELPGIDAKIATALGTTKENISITDMAVNPVSKKLYIAVKSADGTPVLLTLSADNKIEPVALTNVNFSSVELNDAPAAAADPANRRAMQARISSISDMGFINGKLMLSGLCNKEFSSSFRSISFPFAKQEDESTLEMYHTSHGRYETTSPIRTFTTATIAGKEYMVASYTCTPLVLFPMDELKPGAHVKGRTIAEMGNQNTPSDMIWLKEDGQTYLVMANTNRPAVKVNFNDIQKFEGSLTERVATFGGANFTKLPYEKVLQLDKLDDGRAVIIQKKANGDVDLWTSDGKNI